MRARSSGAALPTHAIGVDIADGSLELMNLGSRRDGTPVVIDAARVVLEPHTITHGVITDAYALNEAFRELLSSARLSPAHHTVVTALPDEQVIVKTIPIKQGSRHTHAELAATAEHASRLLGLRLRSPVLRWQYHPRRNTDQPELILYVTQRKFIAQWRNFFAGHSMRLAALEMESHALARALLAPFTHHEDHERVLLIDFGFRQTNVSLFDNSGLCYSHSIEGGGFGLTQALAAHLRISYDHAESLKKRSRLDAPSSDATASVLRSSLEDTLLLIHTSIRSYHRPARSVVITGGGSKLPGMRALAQKILKIPVRRGTLASLGQTRQSVVLDRSPVRRGQEHLYAGALGLALRGADRAAPWRGIDFLSDAS